MLFEGENPYSEEMGLRIREEMGWLGRHTFLYPAFIAFTLPILWLPYPWAITLWLVALQVFLLLSIIMLVDGHRVKPLFLGSLVLVSGIYPLTITAIVLGQFTLYVLFFLVLAYWLWNRENYVLAGCALTQALVKPQLVFLIVACWLLLALKRRNWRFISGFGVSLGLLTLLPMPFIGFWLDDFLFSSSRFEQSAYEAILPQQAGTVLLIGLAVILWSFCLLLWLQPSWSPLKKYDIVSGRWRLGYLISITFVASALTTTRIRNYDLTLAVFSVVYGLLYLKGALGWRVRAMQAALWSALLIVPYVSALLAPDHDSNQIDRLAVSCVMLVILLLLPLVSGPGVSDEDEATPPGYTCEVMDA